LGKEGGSAREGLELYEKNMRGIEKKNAIKKV